MGQLDSLHNLITTGYSLAELQDLCFALGLNYEELGGANTPSARARELLIALGRAGRFDDLLARLAVDRPADFAALSPPPDPAALRAELEPFARAGRPRVEVELGRQRVLQIGGLALLTVVLAAVGFLAFRQWRGDRLGPMTGAFNVAVADFEIAGDAISREEATQLALQAYTYLEQNVSESAAALGLEPALRGPEQVGRVRGADAAERAAAAAEVAERHGADVVVYGVVDSAATPWTVTPEFYVREQSFEQAAELTGQHDLGQPIPLSGQSDIVRRLGLSEELEPRLRLLSAVTFALAFYADGQYGRALELLEGFDATVTDEERRADHLLALLLGNAAGRQGDYDRAEAYYKRSLAADPEYARAYIGLGSAAYGRAIAAEPTDADGLHEALALYDRALTAAHRPALADVEAKVHFGRGQSLLALGLLGEGLGPAATEFEAVIAAYGDGANPRLRELASESHGRLGLIYRTTGEQTADAGQLRAALAEYERAAELAAAGSERRAIFEARAATLRGQLGLASP